MVSGLLHFADFAIGRSFALGPYVLGKDEIIAFAEEFDPQPFHLDEAAAQASILGGLCASGWHTCAIMFRMMADAFILNTASLGSSGLDEVRWLKPVLAGETLTGATLVTDARRSTKNPAFGIVKFRTTLSAGGIEKCTMAGVMFVKAGP